MMAEVLHDAVCQVTGVPSEFKRIVHPGADFEKVNAYPKGTRAQELYDSAVVSYFLSTFGRNEREISCECERSNEPSTVQVLHVINGNTINQKLRAKEGRVRQLVTQDKSDESIVEQAYLEMLSRYPTPEEMKRLLAVLRETKPEEKQVAIEDLYWAILSTREFLFHH